MFNRNPIQRMFIELHDDQKNLLIVKWEDQQLKKGARINVDAEFVAVFINRGKVVGTLGPGNHVLAEGPSALTSWVMDQVTDERLNDLELFFVSTREHVGNPFGGPVDTISVDDYLVNLKVFGEYAYTVVDPVPLLTKFVGTGGFTTDTETRIHDWLAQQVLAAVREEAAEIVAQHGIVNLGATQDEAEKIVLEKANQSLSRYGLGLTGFGELHINVEEQDLQKMKDFLERKKMVGLAGDYETYMRGEALYALGQGDGSGEGGGGGTNMLLLSALLNANKQGNPLVPDVASASPASNIPQRPEPKVEKKTELETVSCVSCDRHIIASYSFCPECGAPQLCECGERKSNSKFCPGCGKANN